MEQVAQVVQMLMLESEVMQSPASPPETLERLTVRRDVRLNQISGRTVIGGDADNGTHRLQVSGDVKAVGYYDYAGQKVVGSQVGGVASPPPYAGSSVSATYVQAEVLTIANALADACNALRSMD